MVEKTASFKELILLADNLAEECIEIGRDSSRLVAAWQEVDKLVMRQVVQSLYHMSWNIKDLRENINEITGSTPEAYRMELEHIRFQDHDSLTRPMLLGRTKNWYRAVKSVHLDMRRILTIMDTVEARPYRVGFIVSRIYLDLHFFKDQYEAATNEKLDD